MMCKFVSAQAIHHVFGRQFWLYNRLVLITLAWVAGVTWVSRNERLTPGTAASAAWRPSYVCERD